MALFFGLAPVSPLLAAYEATLVKHGPGIAMVLAGIGASEEAAPDNWSRTNLPRLSRWNTFRTLACGLSAALPMLSLSLVAQSQPEAA
ncbi:hypothetical protein [Alloyangia pacifica]|uniref:hypothetical protein n=1 Tax=Alloyangia pacifica TaxID=311180 RepID=UPI001CD4A093|nr:hypothetical protein [Alloyangia pacifica]MCA0998603.1 hypothetical protein [Alloyangia pacifica]